MFYKFSLHVLPIFLRISKSTPPNLHPPISSHKQPAPAPAKH